MELIYMTLFEGPLEHAREVLVAQLHNFKNTERPMKNGNHYSFLGAILGVGKGRRALQEQVIEIIDITLGKKEGKLSQNKLTMICKILEVACRERGQSSCTPH